MNTREAQVAIEAILAAIDDDELPEFDKVEIEDDGAVYAWWGSTGHRLGSAMTGGKREPLGLRRSGAWGAIEAEMTYRADRRLLENGDDPTGLDFGARVVSAR